MRRLALLLLLAALAGAPARAASPVLAGSGSGIDTDATSVTATLPAGVVAGDLLIVWFCNSASSGNWDTPSGWTLLSPADGSVEIFWKEAVASEPDPVSGEAGGNAAGWFTARITGAEDPATQAPELTEATGTSSTPDPPSITPTGGSNDYLFLATDVNFDGRRTVSTGPSGYSLDQTFATGGGPSGGTGGLASLGKTATTEDPGTFGISGSSFWETHTIAVHPPGAPPARSRVVDVQ